MPSFHSREAQLNRRPRVPTLCRRSFVTGAAAAVSANIVLSGCYAQTSQSGPFQLPPLAYANNALEPHIDARTMEFHHDRHHGAAVAALNAALKDHGQVAQMRIEQMLFKLAELPEDIRTAVRNNGGSHANHTMFWQIMGKDGGAPDSDLRSAIDHDFGGLAKLQDRFNAAGAGVFGSGWVFLTADGDGALAIVTKPNQDTPLMDGRRAIMGNDVWEHAYYLNYQNRRSDYLKAWWNVINWKAVGERYAAAKAGTLGI
jgi:superoxide dismutase, Fe-Mn family